MNHPLNKHKNHRAKEKEAEKEGEEKLKNDPSEMWGCSGGGWH